MVGVLSGVFLIWVSTYMGKYDYSFVLIYACFHPLLHREFEELSEKGVKVGEEQTLDEANAALQSSNEDTSCGHAEEGQDEKDHQNP